MAGLSAAIHARLQGFDVLLLEQHDQLGGKAGGVSLEGFELDPGPSILILIRLYEAVFRRAGRKMEDYLRFRRLGVLSRIYSEEREAFDIPCDRAACLDFLAQAMPKDAPSLRKLMDRLDRAAPLLDRSIFAHPYCETKDLMDPALMAFGMRFNPFREYKSLVDEWFKDPILRAFFYGFPSYGGQSYRAKGPGGFMIPYFMLAEGVWVAEGGVRAIPLAFARLAEELGVEIRTGCKVQRLWIEQDQTKGVELSTGERLESEVVIAAIDPSPLMQEREPKDWKPSYSYFTLHWGIRREMAGLSHHTLLIPKTFEKSFVELYDQRSFPTRPIVYLNATAAEDPSSAPVGCTNLFAVVTCPSDEPQLDYAGRSGEYEQRIRGELARFGFEWSADEEVFCRLQNPPFFAKRDGNYFGSLYGPDEAHRLWGMFPLANQHPTIKGLFFAGGAVQPGAGLPMVTLSGQFAADLAAKAHRPSQS